MTTGQYRKILASDVLRVKNFTFDVFIKLSENKYLKIVTSNSVHFEEELSHYHKKASDYLYVDESSFETITDLLESESKKMIIPIASEDNLGVASETYIFCHKILRNFGIKELDLELIDNTLISFFNSLKKQAELMKRLQRLLDQKDYITNHSLLTLYVTTLVMKKIGKLNDSLQEKITTASFFKDISLDNSHQARIWNKKDHGLKEMSESEALSVLNHPNKAVEVAKKLKNFSQDLAGMIRDHHELPGGIGFPGSLASPNLSPLATIFNCACHFSQEAIFQGTSQSNAIVIFKKMDDTYSKGVFKSSYLALKGLILNQDSFE